MAPSSQRLEPPQFPGRFTSFNGLGIGYVLHEDDPFTCIDMDVKDAETHPNEPEKWTTAEQLARYHLIIQTFGSYTEYSRSGKGFHIWVKGSIGAGCKHDGVEVYSQQRFIICTGNVYRAGAVAERQELLDMLVGEMRAKQGMLVSTELVEVAEELTDEELWKRASTAVNADKFLSLWNGVWQGEYPSQSEADLSLLSMLTFYSKSNAQCRRMFRFSELGKRGKATKNDYYLDNTLKLIRGRMEKEAHILEHGRQVALRILESLTQKWAPSKAHSQTVVATNPTSLRLVTADEIASRPPMKWLVRGVLPEKGLCAIYGVPGSGKSFLVLDLLAAIAGGFLWFGRPTKMAPVVYVTLEGQAGTPQRINAYRARKGSLDRIAFIEQPVDLREPSNVDALIRIIVDSGLGGGVLCIDTLAASAPGVAENTSEDMGPLIANMQYIQGELNCVVLFVHHSGKDEGKGLRGWSGINGALDSAIAVSRAKKPKGPSKNKDEDGDEETLRCWTVTKSKDGQDGIGSTFDLEIVHLGLDDEGYPISSCVISHTMREWKQTPVQPSELEVPVDEFLLQWIRAEIAKGGHPSGRSVEEQKKEMGAQMKLTQAQIRDSIARLKATGLLIVEKFKGNDWLNVAEVPKNELS